MQQQVSKLFRCVGFLLIMTQFLVGCDVQQVDPYTSHMLVESVDAPTGWQKVSSGRARRWGPTGLSIQFGLPDKDKSWAFIMEQVYSYNTPEQAMKLFHQASEENFIEGTSFIPEGFTFSSHADQREYSCIGGGFNGYPTTTCSVVLLYDHIMVDIGTNAINNEWLTLQDFLDFVEKADQEILKYRPQE